MLKEQGFVRVGTIVPKLRVADTEFNCNEIIKQIEIAKNMLKEDVNIEFIAKVTGLTEEEIKKI